MATLNYYSAILHCKTTKLYVHNLYTIYKPSYNYERSRWTNEAWMNGGLDGWMDGWTLAHGSNSNNIALGSNCNSNTLYTDF